MTVLTVNPLHRRFGVEIPGLDLNSVTREKRYPEIRSAFETYSLLLFRNQSIDDDQHVELAKMFGPLEDRRAHEHQLGEDGFEIPRVSNVKANGQ